MKRDKFLPVFFAHLGITLAAGLLLFPIGECFFEVAHPNAGSYFFWGVYGLIGFPLLDAAGINVRKGVALVDMIGYFWFLLVPINSAIAALLLLQVQKARQRAATHRADKAARQ